MHAHATPVAFLAYLQPIFQLNTLYFAVSRWSLLFYVQKVAAVVNVTRHTDTELGSREYCCVTTYKYRP